MIIGKNILRLEKVVQAVASRNDSPPLGGDGEKLPGGMSPASVGNGLPPFLLMCRPLCPSVSLSPTPSPTPLYPPQGSIELYPECTCLLPELLLQSSSDLTSVSMFTCTSFVTYQVT